jgi:hypothetical protein
VDAERLRNALWWTSKFVIAPHMTAASQIPWAGCKILAYAKPDQKDRYGFMLDEGPPRNCRKPSENYFFLDWWYLPCLKA